MNNKRNSANLVQDDHSQYAVPLPFAPGYSAAVSCRLSHFYRDDVGNIHCQVHNARGIVGARISRPDSHNVGLEEWGIYEVTVVITIGQKDPQAEILKLKKIPEYAHPNLAPLIPYLLCDMPKKLEELCHLIQLVQCRHLQTVLSSVFGERSVYEPLMRQVGGARTYCYPGGLLSKIVAVGREAVRMGFATQAEADLVLASALLYDLGRIVDSMPLDEGLRQTIGFAPHPHSLSLVVPHIGGIHPANAWLRDSLRTGYCNSFPSMSSSLKWDAALSAIERRVAL